MRVLQFASPNVARVNKVFLGVAKEIACNLQPNERTYLFKVERSQSNCFGYILLQLWRFASDAASTGVNDVLVDG